MGRKDDLTGYFDQGVKITGELEFQNTLRIDGTFRGKVRSPDLLVVGEKGDVDGEMDVGILSVFGIVRGKIHTRERLEIQKSGRVYADVTTPSLLIVDGGVLQGNCLMETKERSPKPQK